MIFNSKNRKNFLKIFRKIHIALRLQEKTYLEKKYD